MNSKVEARRVLIGIARRRQQPGAGSRLDFLRARTDHMTLPDLGPILQDVLWAVVGAAATRLYMPERRTQDLDILVRAQDSADVRTRLVAAGFAYQGELSIGGSSWTAPDGLPLYVFECRETWCDPALFEAQTNPDSGGAPVLPLPFLTLMKFQAGRVQDLADITRMLGQAAPERLAAVREVFARWLPNEVLENLIVLGQMEMQEPLQL